MASRRILVVEDDPIMSLHLETIITQAVEADVIVASSAAAARRLLEDPIAFAFLDVDVLDGTTFAFATELDERAISFAFLSASDREQVPSQLRTAPFIAKPYEADTIVKLLREAGKA